MPRLAATESDLARMEELWRALCVDYHRVVAFHVGSGGATKRWPPHLFAGLAERCYLYGLVPILLAGPQDEDSVQAVIAACTGIPHPPVITDLSLGELSALLGRVAAYVGNDSGVTHLAALSGPRPWRCLGQPIQRTGRRWDGKFAFCARLREEWTTFHQTSLGALCGRCCAPAKG